jgi:hypothetical protein
MLRDGAPKACACQARQFVLYVSPGAIYRWHINGPSAASQADGALVTSNECQQTIECPQLSLGLRDFDLFQSACVKFD